jgi:hypothetical protein
LLINHGETAEREREREREKEREREPLTAANISKVNL